ncbi:MAG: hypothetical protein CMI95_02635 [Pelagibacteraceae bacterium]|nr:hypothetical protein [Pelagibacteraceae bacterium]|tara:strand:- start:69 stop:284 length:216 start_codon:yes stop_codon:yes gene_type:complete
MNTVKSFIGSVMDIGMALIPLIVVLGIIFGNNIPFVGFDVVDNISMLINDLGSGGLVGLATVGILWALFRR